MSPRTGDLVRWNSFDPNTFGAVKRWGIVLGPADGEFVDPRSRSFMMLVLAQSGARIRLLLNDDNVVQRCKPPRGDGKVEA